jgi:hypothetical protein
MRRRALELLVDVGPPLEPSWHRRHVTAWLVRTKSLALWAPWGVWHALQVADSLEELPWGSAVGGGSSLRAAGATAAMNATSPMAPSVDNARRTAARISSAP